MELEIIDEEKILDPVKNIERDFSYWKAGKGGSARVWKNGRCVILGKFQEAEREVRMDLAAKLGIPVLKRASGGGAVYHDRGNLNYSLYLDKGGVPLSGIEASLRALSLPVISLLSSMGVAWQWVPPNNIYVEGRKISGSAQARSGGRLLHHGTLLVQSDLEEMTALLKAGGSSRLVPVINLKEVLPGVDIAEVEELLEEILRMGVRY